MVISEQQQVRLEKRQSFLALGIQPYPESSDVLTDITISEIREKFDGVLEVNETSETEVNISGRVMFKRGGGKIAFITLQEGSGARIQVMLTADLLGDGNVDLGKSLIKDFIQRVDIGDIVWFSGFVASSMTGELSVKSSEWRMVSKAINPLPNLHDELSDEKSIRERYAQLIVDEKTRRNMKDRSRIISSIRETLENQEFVEIETPILQNIHGGAQARPFKTHFNAFDQDVSLRIALELNLKKAVVGGFDRVFEIGKVFRNEGSDSTHSPEFTMLEAYQTYSDMWGVMKLLKNIIQNASARVERLDNPVTSKSGILLDLANDATWSYVSFYDALSHVARKRITSSTPAEELLEIAERENVVVAPGLSAGKIAMEIFSSVIEPNAMDPVFFYDYPAEAQPLARRSDNDPKIVQAWDLIICGREIGTGFTELNDPVVQREILTEQSLKTANGDPEAMQLDEDFLNALQYGCPPMGGIGLGIDRLVMLLLGIESIRESQMFPFVRKV